MNCDLCKMPLELRDAYQRVTGWERPHHHGSAKSGSSLVLRERLQEFACGMCIARLRVEGGEVWPDRRSWNYERVACHRQAQAAPGVSEIPGTQTRFPARPAHRRGEGRRDPHPGRPVAMGRRGRTGGVPHFREASPEYDRPRRYPSHGEPYDPRLDWPERYTDGPI